MMKYITKIELFLDKYISIPLGWMNKVLDVFDAPSKTPAWNTKSLKSLELVPVTLYQPAENLDERIQKMRDKIDYCFNYELEYLRFPINAFIASNIEDELDYLTNKGSTILKDLAYCGGVIGFWGALFYLFILPSILIEV